MHFALYFTSILQINYKCRPKALYHKNTSMGYTLRAGGLVAMTEAFQASNPGSNPGRRILCIIGSNIVVNTRF